MLESGGVDFVLLQFSISAVAPKDMARVARLVEQALRPGGKLLLRDYGRCYYIMAYLFLVLLLSLFGINITEVHNK